MTLKIFGGDMEVEVRVFVIVFLISAVCVGARELYAQTARDRTLPDDRTAPQPPAREAPTRVAPPYAPPPPGPRTADGQEYTMISYVIFTVFGGAILYLAYKGQKK